MSVNLKKRICDSMKLFERPRRLRKNSVVRELVAESSVGVHQLIYPLFVYEGDGPDEPLLSLPGLFRFSQEGVKKEIESCLKINVNTFALFPIVGEKNKTSRGEYSYSSKNFYLQTIRELKRLFPELCLVTDVALDPYSSDGHDGLVKKGQVLNDETLKVLTQMALAQADAGADIIAPSDMMDGRIGAIRTALEENHYINVVLMSYAAKYASHFYGPFREALDSSPHFGDKKTYQMDFRNRKEALKEARLDVSEGADILMVKPGLLYLDVISDFKQYFDLPIAAYSVSGEYAMVKAAAKCGWVENDLAIVELLTAFKRSGADIIITYFAKEFASLKIGMT